MDSKNVKNEVVVVNEKDEVVGTMPRAEAHANGTPHRIAVVYLENDKDEVLVQVRMSGTFDHSSAGHVDPGETYLQTALREVKEELGIENIDLLSAGKGISDEKARKERNDNGVPEHRVHVFEVFVCRADPKNLAADEVKSVYWAQPKDILEDMKKNPEKYTGGFTSSLQVYLAWKNKKQ